MTRQAVLAVVELVVLMTAAYFAGWHENAATCVALVAMSWVDGYRRAEGVELVAQERLARERLARTKAQP